MSSASSNRARFSATGTPNPWNWLGIGERRGRRVGEDGVALELDEAQRVAQARDDQRRELGHDAMGVLELSVRQERGVPGDVGEDQIALRQRAGRRQRRYASFGMT